MRIIPFIFVFLTAGVAAARAEPIPIVAAENFYGISLCRSAPPMSR
jgi:hypothetical protein